MRKILSLMMMCLLAVGALHAETYVMADMSGLPTENGDFTLTFGTYTMNMAKNNGTTAPAYNATGLDVRVYAKGSVQLTTTGDAMTQVVFNISTQGKRRQAEITPSTGSVTIDMDAATVTWTGSATDVTFTVGDKAEYGSDGNSKAGQFCFVSVDITGGGSGVETVAKPVITPAAGTYYAPINVSMKCGTTGANIYYTTNGTTPTASSTLYTAPFTLNADATVKAIAIKGALSSDVVEVAYAFGTATQVANIAEYQAVDDETIVQFTNPVNVLAQNTLSSGNVRLFVQDATGNMFIFGKAGKKYNNGDVIPAGFTGTKKTFNGEVELEVTETSNFQDASSNSPIAPETIQAIDVEADLFAHYVYIAGASLAYTTTSNGKELTSLTDNSGTVAARNSMGITASTIDYDATYNVTAVIGSYKTDSTDVVYQVWPVKLEKVGGSTVTDGVATIAEYLNLADDATFTFTGNAVVTYRDANDQRYLYIKDATGSALIYGSGFTFNQGDVLKSGWKGTKTNYNGLYEVKDASGLAASGNTQTVTPVEKTTADVTTANQNIYCVLRGVKIASVNGRNFTFADGTAGYNQFNGTVTLPSDLTQEYDIEGIISVRNNAQFIPTRFLTEVVVPDVADLATLYTKDEGKAFNLQSTLTAIYQSGYDLYVKDNSGFGLVYGHLNETFENGDQIQGAQVSWQNYNGIPELIPTASTFVKSGTGAAVQPEQYAIEDLSTDMVNNYIVLKDVTIAAIEGEAKNFTLTDETGNTTMRNKYNLEVTEGTTDVTGFVSLYEGALQILPIKLGSDVPGVRGDLDDSGVVDIDDLNIIINMMLNKADKTAAADLNGDGNVDVDDMNIILNIMLGKA